MHAPSLRTAARFVPINAENRSVFEPNGRRTFSCSCNCKYGNWWEGDTRWVWQRRKGVVLLNTWAESGKISESPLQVLQIQYTACCKYKNRRALQNSWDREDPHSRDVFARILSGPIELDNKTMFMASFEICSDNARRLGGRKNQTVANYCTGSQLTHEKRCRLADRLEIVDEFKNGLDVETVRCS